MLFKFCLNWCGRGIDVFVRCRSLQLVIVTLEEATLLALVGATVLLEQLERALACLVALAGQELQGLLASSHLLAADDTSVLVLHQVLLFQATGGVLGSSVKHLCLGSNSCDFGHLIFYGAI